MSYDDYGPPMPARGQQTSGRGRGGKPDLGDYVEVKDRVAEFYKRYPTGRIETRIVGFTEERVTVQAYVYRPDEHVCAAIGHSSMRLPGKTPYTKDSELENAETSAVGRALGFMGILTDAGLASAQEVASKRDAEPAPAAASPAAPEPRRRPSRAKPATDTPPAPEAKGDAPEPAPVDILPLVDANTGEVIGLTRDEFVEGLREHFVTKQMAIDTFARLYPGQDASKATPAMRLAVLNAAIEAAHVEVPT